MRLVLKAWETRRYQAGQLNLTLLGLGPNGEGDTFVPPNGFAGLMGGEDWFLGKEVKNNGQAYPQGSETLSPPVPE